MKQVLSVLALAAATGLAMPAFAQTYRAVASGPAESPPNGSPGSSMVTIDIGSSNLMVDMSFRDLVGTASAAHIHCCTTDAFTGTTAIAMPFTDFPTGEHTGDYTMAIPLYEDTSYDPAFLKAYVNIHTSEFPGGEIRGFIVAAPVPEPAEWGMMAGGLAGLLWMGRRKRREVSWQR
jgi:hypothetical protein